MRTGIRGLALVSVVMALVLAAPTGALAAKNSIGSVNATPRSISFGKVAVGSQSARNTFWISNDTKAVLWILGVSAPTGRDADDFWFGRLTLSDCADALGGDPLDPGETCGGAVGFNPTESGRHSASVVISLADGVRTFTVTVPLSGTGI